MAAQVLNRVTSSRMTRLSVDYTPRSAAADPSTSAARQVPNPTPGPKQASGGASTPRTDEVNACAGAPELAAADDLDNSQPPVHHDQSGATGPDVLSELYPAQFAGRHSNDGHGRQSDDNDNDNDGDTGFCGEDYVFANLFSSIGADIVHEIWVAEAAGATGGGAEGEEVEEVAAQEAQEAARQLMSAMRRLGLPSAQPSLALTSLNEHARDG